ncbi:MAG: hypothetical protein U9Q03_01465 [Patescibacteria group bacterium]|nr:hypothetical protein [Patescibacteria group bacterium]
MKIKFTFSHILMLASALLVVIGAIAFLGAYPYRGEGVMDLVWAMLVMLVMAALAAFMYRFRLTTWLTITFLGYIVGLVSGTQLLAVPNVAGGYAVAVLTVVTFAGHGFVIGMFAEFIVWLHGVTHILLDHVMKEGVRPRKSKEPKDNEKVRLPENRE